MSLRATRSLSLDRARLFSLLFVGLMIVGCAFAAEAQTLRRVRINSIDAVKDSPDGVTLLQYRTKQDGNWNDAATWEQSADGSTWVPALTFPTSANSSAVTIRTNAHVTLTGNDSVSSLTNFGFIEGSGNLTFTGNFTNNFFSSSTGTFTFSGFNNTQVLSNLLAQTVVIAHTGTGGVQTSGNPIANTLLHVQSGTYTTGGSADYVRVQIDSGATMAMAPGATIEVGSDWSNQGTFTANGGVVYLDGQLTGLVSGNTTFAGLVLGAGIPNATLTFEAGSTQTVTQAVQMQGDTVTPTRLVLKSSVPGTRWNFRLMPGASQAVAYVSVRDSDASSGQTIVPDASSVNGGNNLNWAFPLAADVTISGNVTTSEGRGITNAVITVSGETLPQPITVLTGRNGAYFVRGLEAGQTYVVSVAARRFTFHNPAQVVTLSDNADGINFIGSARGR